MIDLFGGADLLDAAGERFLGHRLEGRGGKRAWFTDSLTTADAMARVLAALPGPVPGGRVDAVEAVTCSPADGRAALPVHRFRTQMRVTLPGWERRKLLLPPLLEVIDRCETERYAEIVISTPGPFGLLGVAAGKLLGIPVTAVWQEDLPARVLAATRSETLEEMTWTYLRRLFGQAGRIWVPSRREHDALVAHAFAPERISLLPGRTARPESVVLPPSWDGVRVQVAV